MKDFGRLTLILGLAVVASVVYIHTWDIAFRKGPFDDIAENIEKSAAEIKEAADEVRKDQKNREKNSEESRKSNTTNTDESLGGTEKEKEKSQKSKDKKSEEKVKTKISESKNYPNNTQYKKEEINKDEFAPESLPDLYDDPIIQAPRQERIDPFSGIVLPTISNKPNIFKKQSRANTFTKKSVESKDPFAKSTKAEKSSTSKTKNTKAVQKQTNEITEYAPLQEGVNTDTTKSIE